ncbi:MAG TPA: peptidoglycan-binding protein [Clostridiales bacterium]|nr:peptidoglycan-binding protein [Clostridiales bacterium]
MTTIAYILGILLTVTLGLTLTPAKASAHCNTMDGPTAKDGVTTLETGNINYAAKWIMEEYEDELSEIFNLSQKVRALSPDAKELADRFFLESLVRIHRAGEGAPYEGLKPKGTPIDEKVAAADKSIEIGNLSPLKNMVTHEELHALEEKFQKAMALKNYDMNDLDAARAYVQAYVSFFKLAEGEEHDHGEHGHGHAH